MNDLTTTVLSADHYGDASVLSFVKGELPAPGPQQVVVDVQAAGINPIDARRMTGEFRHSALPQYFGTEFAGVIAAVGSAVSDWKVGDAVLGSGDGFTHATRIVVPAANLVAKPAGLAWEVAGSLAGVGQTASTILRELALQPGQWLLIHGGSGGVGSITIQLAKALGIHVVATASAANQDYLRQLGALPVVYGDGMLERIKAVHAGPFDAAVDMAGSPEAIEVSLALVPESGHIGSIAGKPVSSPRVKAMWVKRNVADLQRVVDGVAKGEFNWEVSRTYPFSDARQAYADILQGHTRGKSVLLFDKASSGA